MSQDTVIPWFHIHKTADTSIYLCEKNEVSEQAVEETEPMMKPYRDRSTSWDYRSASALIYEAFRQYEIPLEQYRVSDSGRPYIAGGRGDISISHSGHYTVVAITGNPELSIGIDIEEIERARKRNIRGIAKRFFPEKEFIRVRDSEDPAIEFLNLWTQKEARMKALRVPLAQTLGENVTESAVPAGDFHNKEDFMYMASKNYVMTTCFFTIDKKQ